MKKFLPNDLFSFVEVVSSGGFSPAAQKLGVSPSVLSKRIQRLEKELRVNLLQRTTRKLHLTQIGEACYKEMVALQHRFDLILTKIDETQHQTQGKLRISAPYGFGQLQLSPVLWDFMKEYPDIDVELLLGQTTTQLLEKNIDIGIFTQNLPDSRLVAKPIGTRRMYVCASPDYFKISGKQIPNIPQALVNHNCLLYRGENLAGEWEFYQANEKILVNIQGNFSANSSQVLLQAAVAGKGIVKLPGYVTHQALKDKKLISMLDDYCPKNIGIFAAYPFTLHLSSRVKVLIDFLTKQFKNVI